MYTYTEKLLLLLKENSDMFTSQRIAEANAWNVLMIITR